MRGALFLPTLLLLPPLARPGTKRPSYQGGPGRRRAEGDAGAPPRPAGQRQSVQHAAAAGRDCGRWHSRRQPASGNYTVESDQPVVPGQGLPVDADVDIAAGRDASLELTAANAEIGPVTSATATAAPIENDPSSC